MSATKSKSSVEGKLLPMRVEAVRHTKKALPTGDPKFSVNQAFPAAFDEFESDPFLMCDHWGPVRSKGKSKDPDVFPVNWHPHRGIDLLTYKVQGRGRHADSLGNREEFDAPGMQWISSGSGIEHAEGGGGVEGELDEGFQIWVNVPSTHKMNDPRYGTIPPEDMPVIKLQKGFARVLAGPLDGQMGPFKTVQDVQMVDFVLEKGATHEHVLPDLYNSCLVYLHKGSAKFNGTAAAKGAVVKFDAGNASAGERVVKIEATDDMACIVFAGVRLNEPIAWHGPFVMNTQQEIHETISEYRVGKFLKKRAPFDYKRLADFPKDKL